MASSCGNGSRRIGFIKQRLHAPPPLTPRQRAGRAAAGVGLIALARLAKRIPPIVGAPLGLAIGWVGLSHTVAAATGYNGCPELGAIPSLVLRRNVQTRCGPWQRIDHRLGLAEPRTRSPERVHA